MNRPRETNEAQLRAAREVPFATAAPAAASRHPAPEGPDPRRRARPLHKATWWTLLLLLAFNLVFGAAALEAEPSDAEWTAMFDELHTLHFDEIQVGDMSYLIEVFKHSMGENFHAPPGATESFEPWLMAYALFTYLHETWYGSPGRPHVWHDPLMEDRPAMTFWDATGVRYVFWNPAHYYPSYSESASAYYLEQVGHYLNAVRCDIAGAPIGQDGESCPTDQGGSAGARFRDLWLVLGPTATAEEAAQFSEVSHPRSQLVTEPYYFGFIDSDGQSSVTPIDIITDTVNNSYSTRAVANLIAADGEASGLFRYLEEEHGLPIPELTWQGAAMNTQFVVENDRLVRVEFPSINPAYRQADQFWYTVAQALVDTIHGPLVEDEMCKVRIDYLALRTHHLWLDYSAPQQFDLAMQSEECLHRDALAHKLAGVLVHQHEVNPQSQEQMDQLFDQIYPRHPVAARNLYTEITPRRDQECVVGPLGVQTCLPSGNEVHKKTNSSSASSSSLTTLVAAEQSCQPKRMADWEDPACFEDWGEEEQCVSLLSDIHGTGTWSPDLEHCSTKRRIMCQRVRLEEGTERVLYRYQDYRITEDPYPLRYADHACALEFPPGDDPPHIYTGAWRKTGSLEHLGDYGEILGSGARECKPGKAGNKRTCSQSFEVNPLDPSDPAKRIKVGRARGSSAIRQAINALATKATTQEPLDHDALRVHAVAIGAGSCHLVQCERHRSGKATEYENVLVDCGSIGRGENGLDAAGALSYLEGAGFYRSTQPPLIISTHADSDHFNIIPDLLLGGSAHSLSHVKWTKDIQKMYLGGWPEEYVGRYIRPNLRGSSEVTEDTRIGTPHPTSYVDATGAAGGRGPLRAYLQARQAADPKIKINGTDLTQGESLNSWMSSHPWQRPVDDSYQLHQFNGCGKAKLNVIAVNTPPDDASDPEAHSQSVRRNRASAVLELAYPHPNPNAGFFFKAILPGDALQETENAAIDILDGNNPGGWGLSASHKLLLASHHGSGRHGSNHDHWRQTIFPSRVIYSSGERFHHPRLDVVQGYHHQLSSVDVVPLHVVSSGALILDFPNEDYNGENLTDDEEASLDDDAYDTETYFAQGWGYVNLVSTRKHNNTRDNGSMVYSVIIPIDENGQPGTPTTEFSKDRESPPPAN